VEYSGPEVRSKAPGNPYLKTPKSKIQNPKLKNSKTQKLKNSKTQKLKNPKTPKLQSHKAPRLKSLKARKTKTPLSLKALKS
jgi:adenine specific DNA methylase Mod